VIRHVLAGARDLLYPQRCTHCGRFGKILCDACLGSIGRDDPAQRCPNCTAAWDGDLNCPRCYFWDSIDLAKTAHGMTGIARSLVHGLKYSFIESLALPIAIEITPLLDACGDAIVLPVPLHRSRLRQRGFNQAELILRHTGWAPGDGTLIRRRKTETQVGKRARDRVQNVGGAFAYTGPELIGKTIVVFDDVITTGATANECARVLRDHGAIKVFVVAYARASHDPARGDEPIAD
jgi:ComF family protein